MQTAATVSTQHEISRRNLGFRSPSSGLRPDRSGIARLLLGLACFGCTAAVDDLAEEPELAAPAGDELKGCYGKASSSIPTSGVYVLTTFGGPSEPQPLACGGHSKSGSWYYAASRQRYGCGSRVSISANGKCVVAQTDDYGPDVCVEKAAGSPIMDVSPLVAKQLFGTSSWGWSDKKKVTVVEVDPDTPLGPCSSAPAGGTGGGGTGGGSAGTGSGGGGAGGSGGSSGSGGAGSSGGASFGSGGGQACSSDGACNPGNDGSGMICVSGKCVPGCKTNAQCPGVKTCKNGMCS